jgi:cytochrome P450
MELLSRIFRRSKKVPGTNVDLAAPDVARDPFPHYEKLRRAGAVQRLHKHDAWIVLGYEEVQYAFAHPEIFSNRPYSDVDAVLLAADPPRHQPVRRIVSRYFAPEVIEDVCTFAEEMAGTLLGARIDVVRDYAQPLSDAVAARLLGLDERATSDIRAARAEAPELGPFTRALDQIAERATIYERLLGDGVGEEDARSLIRLLWLAATTTTERVIARCILRLLQHDEIRRDLQHNPRIEAFVEEVLRLHPGELLVPRIALRDAALGNAVIPANALVHLSIAAANRDPAKFDDAASLRLDRPPCRHFTFGSGLHHCIGATLARRVVTAAVRTLLTLTPRFQAARTLDSVTYWSTMTANTVERLVLDTRPPSKP